MAQKNKLPLVFKHALFSVVVACCLLAVISIIPARGQSGSMGSVIIALPDAFPHEMTPGGPQGNILAITLRAPGKADIIILNPKYATPGGLASAIAGLKNNRIAMPNPENGVMLVANAAPPKESSHQNAVMARALAKIRQQANSRVGNLGSGRWYEFSAQELGM